MPDVVVIGAGIIGAACAYYAAQAGLSVTVVDQAGVAGGTTGAGEGNILVSDKPAGPDLELALRSNELWRELDREVGGFELEYKGGLVVADTPAEMEALRGFVAEQLASPTQPTPAPNAGAHPADGPKAGAQAPGLSLAVREVADLHEVEPHLAPGLAGGFFYPQDLQVQPMLAAARLLQTSGATVLLGHTVTGISPGKVETDRGTIHTDAIVNAAGVWAGEVGGIPILPRRGFILVTSRQPILVRHKVYAASYVGAVVSDSADLRTSPVIEGTPAGSILIGSSRERVGFASEMSLPVLRLLAQAAIRLFPVLRDVPVIRAYKGFRPYSPDHLPIIGPDPRVPGLFHAAGHEGGGIGLAPVTGRVITDQILGRESDVDTGPLRPERFTDELHV